MDRHRCVIGADDGTRTRNRRFTKPLLYQLSYVGAAQGHTAGDPEAPANDMAPERKGSSVHVVDRPGRPGSPGRIRGLARRLAGQQVGVQVRGVRSGRSA